MPERKFLISATGCIGDATANGESRRGTISAFNGIEPITETLRSRSRGRSGRRMARRLYRRSDAAERNRGRKLL
jgi:hypothetical protein